MHILQSIIMGIVQGLSEFLPISSSAHLVITSNLYKVLKGLELTQESSQEIFLDIMLHLGTLIAVLIYFRKDIIEILKAFLSAVKSKDFSDSNAKMALYILIGTIITVVIAFPLHDVAENLVYSPAIVGLLLIFTGILLFSAEAFSKRIQEKSNKIDLKTSIFIAVAQGLAALPGFSRSGLTIATGLLNKKDRLTAARYSFLLSIPIILGASMVYPLIKIDLHEFTGYNWNAIIIGTIVSAIVGYICIKYFLKFVGKYSLAFFGYYCIIVGALSFVFFNIFASGV
ncbi:TPA: undecaprenyl-diphosphate phosphatase [Candidatus Avigastranaerophilus faecigallinarum]|nr:undecaprenyl-diphosphate phosphatase [Candidatus Avigastranaerophilus faecigallinarum]